MKKVLTTFIAAAIALATFSGVAQAQTAPEDLPVGYTGVTSIAHGFTIVESGFVPNSTPIKKFVVSIKNKDMITVNYQNLRSVPSYWYEQNKPLLHSKPDRPSGFHV